MCWSGCPNVSAAQPRRLARALALLSPVPRLGPRSIAPHRLSAPALARPGAPRGAPGGCHRDPRGTGRLCLPFRSQACANAAESSFGQAMPLFPNFRPDLCVSALALLFGVLALLSVLGAPGGGWGWCPVPEPQALELSPARCPPALPAAASRGRQRLPRQSRDASERGPPPQHAARGTGGPGQREEVFLLPALCWVSDRAGETEGRQRLAVQSSGGGK